MLLPAVLRRAVLVPLTAVILALQSLLPAVAATPTTWYLDCSASRNGTGRHASPWNSLATANAHLFRPGDRLLLKRGTTCKGTLKPRGSGTDGAPITLAGYGAGRDRPVVSGDAAATEKAAVHLHNVEQWEIRDLEITFPDSSTARRERNGLLVEIADLPDGVGTHYVVDDVHVHHVDGDATKWSNGIQFRVSGTTRPTNFDDVLVQNSRITAVDREGLTNRTTWMCRPIYGSGDGCGSTVNWRANTGIVFRGNSVSNTGGDGIVVRASSHALVEHNTVHDIAMRPMGSNVGIWTINSDDTLIQHNEVHHVRKLPGNGDGQAFDSDYGNNRAVFQYNHSHDNEGGFMLFCGGCGTGSSSHGTVVRYNLSRSDKGRVFDVTKDDNARVYNNTVYLPAGSRTAVVHQRAATTNMVLSGNIFYNLGSGGYSGPKYTPSDFLWNGNTFYGHHPADEPVDAARNTADPKIENPGGTRPGDYRLTPGSPALRAGGPVAAGATEDYFGSPAPGVCRPDAGFHQLSDFDDGDCPAPDLAIDTGFESGTLAAWSPYGSVGVVTTHTHSGLHAVRVGPAQAAVEQVVQLKPHTTYRLSGYGKVSSAGTQVSLGAKGYDGAGSSTRHVFTRTSYTRGSTTFTTGATSDTAKIYCYARSGTGNGYCDDITLLEN
ncbi:carbohydrate binding domain-containing protein [Streptomyces sp. NPDC057099]|uniref:carbohydrate binding domain-containing protein n=1 Tax=Streptomyces sp. NPDC057099 TaxID=3346019 RepID=UPI003642DD08